MSERIARAFRTDKRAALIPYLVGGFPDLEASRAIGLACADAGADLVEVGIPFSDPLADGPTIHAAASQALRGGATVSGVLGICEKVAERVPVAVMVYSACVLAHGVEHFARTCAQAGVSAVIVPDLPAEEAGQLREACSENKLAAVPLVAPTTPSERLAAILDAAEGFVYAVSTTGTTGERGEIPPQARATVRRLREVTDLPVAVGFGVSTASQARGLAEFADGVIVGSRVVRAADEGGAAEVQSVVAGLASGLA